MSSKDTSSSTPPDGVPPLPNPLGTPEAAEALGGQAIPLFRKPAQVPPQAAASQPSGKVPATVTPIRRTFAPAAEPSKPALFATKPAGEAAIMRARVDSARRSTEALAAAIGQHAQAILQVDVDMDTLALARIEGFDLASARGYAQEVLAAHDMATAPQD